VGQKRGNVVNAEDVSVARTFEARECTFGLWGTRFGVLVKGLSGAGGCGFCGICSHEG
jgi:hypothetical protein